VEALRGAYSIIEGKERGVAAAPAPPLALAVAARLRRSHVFRNTFFPMREGWSRSTEII
jgi:hypothetical protein